LIKEKTNDCMANRVMHATSADVAPFANLEQKTSSVIAEASSERVVAPEVVLLGQFSNASFSLTASREGVEEEEETTV
jgi:hypothetical protein